ncbi:isocitrate lyase/phosphoenolpyruvate mutase family protein [Paenibacillus sp. MSJ-34]|uniref:isocitrate lyase/phosphoenolpyruvate mutase family protein n=1 Tax=Paenibacillus sp. MSJ-34 TaxID=2841529 RepID=UPI00209CEC4A|nr:isocitrate lyase/phosphoenolpyruvate mutase family protein [Paenibacillus sp. MSJ-34]
MKKTSKLKHLVQTQNLEFLMEAHNGLSAKIVEETGFKGIWASGLSISAAMGVRDNNEASWTQVLDVLEFMSDATSIPILLDGDTGYGNFNNARRLVKKLEQRQIAGVCIEDKVFPKTNSFINGNAQPLASRWIDRNRSFFFVVRNRTFDQVALRKQELVSRMNHLQTARQEADQYPSRYEALTVINAMKDRHTVQLATTGITGRELYEIEDSPNNLYMVGSMGCVSSFGLGLALTQRNNNKDIVVIDGDGSVLMRMGSLATNGTYSPPNMLHILLDNNAHDSTGGQSTVSHNVQFVKIAASCGYVQSIYTHNLAELQWAMEEWKRTKGLTFLYMKISKGYREQLGRPQIKPFEIKQRLQSFLRNDPPEGGQYEKRQEEYFA